jgi:uncharacterized Tic20 family protein
MAGGNEKPQGGQPQGGEGQRPESKAGGAEGGAQEVKRGVETNSDARMWAMFCHLGGLGVLMPLLPFYGGALAPLILWQIKKDAYPFVDEQGKEALNFQITALIAMAVSAVLICVVIGAFLFPAVLVLDLVFIIIGAVKANAGEHYRYPICIRFVK